MLANDTITTALVGNEIGTASRSLSVLCAGAKSGGINGYAFNIVEAGGNINSGYLINGATPYFNIYSDSAPGEWFTPSNSGDNLSYRIRRDVNGRYRFSLGDYRNYNHQASAPFTGNASASYEQGTGNRQFNTTLRPSLGSYNWRKVANATMFQVTVYDGEGVIASGTAPISDSLVIPISFTVSTNSVGTTEYVIKISIGTGSTTNYSEIGKIPVTGSISITITRKKVSTAEVIVGNSFRAFDVANGVLFGNEWRYVGTYNLSSGVATSGKRLRSITYTDSLHSLDVTSFNGEEGPTSLSRHSEGDITETFRSSANRGFVEPFSVLFLYS